MIHHPGLGPKKLSMRGGRIIESDAHQVTYVIASQAGSAGAPVLDMEWRVVATHRAFQSYRPTPDAEPIRAKLGTATSALLKVLREIGPGAALAMARGRGGATRLESDRCHPLREAAGRGGGRADADSAPGPVGHARRRARLARRDPGRPSRHGDGHQGFAGRARAKAGGAFREGEQRERLLRVRYLHPPHRRRRKSTRSCTSGARRR